MLTTDSAPALVPGRTKRRKREQKPAHDRSGDVASGFTDPGSDTLTPESDETHKRVGRPVRACDIVTR